MLQEALNRLVEWATQWQLEVSIEKCFILNICNIANSAALSARYYINEHELPVVEFCRDLGVTMSNDLSPRLHINAVVLKAQQRANVILRSFVSRDVALLLQAFIVYVRPLLEYNSVVWTPVLKCDIECVERVQRSFTKRLPGLHNLTYVERLNKLNLITLELRRVHIDLLWCYRIVFGLCCLKFNDFFVISPSNVTRGHPYKLFKQRCSGGPRNNFFTNRIVNIWNSLPYDTVDFSSLNAFKRSIENVDFSAFVHVK